MDGEGLLEGATEEVMGEAASLRAIVNRLVGDPRTRGAATGELAEPWGTIYQRVRRAASFAEACGFVWRATEGLEDRYGLYYAVEDLLPTDAAFSRFPSMLEESRGAAEVEWVWRGWVPKGLVSILGAVAGDGEIAAGPGPGPAHHCGRPVFRIRINARGESNTRVGGICAGASSSQRPGTTALARAGC